MISLRHALDLMVVGPAVVARMGHTEQLRRRMPELERTLAELARRLDALGTNGLRLLSLDRRMAAALRRRTSSRPLKLKRKLGDEGVLWGNLPGVLAELEEIAASLDELGCDGLELLRGDPQLAAALCYREDWLARREKAARAAARPDGDSAEAEGEKLDFTIIGSAVLDQLRATSKIMARMQKTRQNLRLELRDGRMTIHGATVSFSLPATHSAEGTQPIHPGFLSLLGRALKLDEVLRCMVSPAECRINGWRFKPPAA